MLPQIVHLCFKQKNSLLPFVSKFHQQFHLSKCLYQTDVNRYLSEDLPDSYSQIDTEAFWSNIWCKSKLFKNESDFNSTKENFRLLFPPPNITGSLHLGHSLTVSIQDALCRYHRMNGLNVKWYGGTDHAGIATQMVVEKILWNDQHKTRHDVSPEELQKAFDSWKVSRIEQIQKQLKSIGVCIDFESDYFTLSPVMSQIVNEAFIELFNRNLIYRMSRMVNWSYYLQSTLSDIEIEHKFISKPTLYEIPGCNEKFLLGVLHYFKYPLENPDSNEHVTIATTRLESLMGDVALCVNPNDEKNSHLIGKFAFNPFTKQRIPILPEDSVKPDFGTGVLKITPAHSSIDFEIAKRHDLPSINIFDDNGNIKCDYDLFNGVHRYAAKDLVKSELERMGLYCHQKDHPHWLPVCARSGDIIESRIVPQWFLKCDDARYITEYVVNTDNLTENSKQKWNDLKQNLDVKNRNIFIIPSSYRNTWKDWFSRYQDWCISRQIYWGHRIPAYQIYRNSLPTDNWVAAKNEQEAYETAKSKYNLADNDFELKQDNDVLDTWFSSALLPLAVTGYFNGQTYNDGAPLSLMETGHDIIFFWVARMVLLSVLLSNKIPFNKVLLHGMVCDENGKKMSKSKGNVVDPMHLINGASLDDLIEQYRNYYESGLITEEAFSNTMKLIISNWNTGIPICGADILRLSLLQTDFKQQNVKFNLKNAVKKRTFSNKMYQTVRFILTNLDEDFQVSNISFDQLNYFDKWILSKLSKLITLCRLTFNSYDMQYATRQVEKFWIEDLCSIYLESIKKDIYDKNERYQISMSILNELTLTSLKLIHPFMPFITENLFQKINFTLAKNQNAEYTYKSILDHQYPNCKQHSLLKYFDSDMMEDFEKMRAVIQKIRWFKQNFMIFREPLIQNIQIATLLPNFSDFKQEIEKLVKCNIDFVDLNEIYKFDNCYCVRVNTDTEVDDTSSSSSDSDSESKSGRNFLEMNELYLLFFVDKADIQNTLSNPKFRLSKSKIQSLLEELDSLHMEHFTKNYKKSTKIVN